MASAVSALYEPFIERDLEAIAPAVRAFRQHNTSEELFLAIARFAVLSYAPSQHAKHAVLAALSAFEVREAAGERWDELLVECARYVAGSRQPWSEPPITDPPQIDVTAPADTEELRAAIADGDRLRSERWLARRLDDPSLPRDLMAVAAEDLSDMGHKVIMANAALKLVPILGEKRKFATLRMAVWEMTAYNNPPVPAAPADVNALIERCVQERGSLESAHAIFLFDAMQEGGVLVGAPAPTQKHPLPIYSLARDLGAYLKAHAVAQRLRTKHPNADADSFIRAVYDNLEHGPSLEEWSFV